MHAAPVVVVNIKHGKVLNNEINVWESSNLASSEVGHKRLLNKDKLF